MNYKYVSLLVSALFMCAGVQAQDEKTEAVKRDPAIKVYLPGHQPDEATAKKRADYCASMGMVDVTSRGLLIEKGSSGGVVCEQVLEGEQDMTPFDINTLDPEVFKALVTGDEEGIKKQ